MKVSKKGQIVIPASYRDRLGIESGMEVQFRIRGHYLLVELDTDVGNDLQYLRDKKNKLGEEDMADEHQIQEIIYDLLAQQFYYGDDNLTDRVGRTQYKVRGSDTIVKEAVGMLVHAGRHWLKGNYIDTLKEIADSLELDFPSLLSKFVGKLRSMDIGGDEMIRMMGGEVVFSMVIGEALMQFRTRIGDETRERILKEVDVLGYIDKLGDETVEEIVVSGLADKYSILLNLRVLREFARMSVKSIGARKFDTINKDLLSEFDGLETPDHIIKRRERRKKRAAKKAKKSPAVSEKTPTPIDDEFEEIATILPEIDDDSSNDLIFEMPDIPDID